MLHPVFATLIKRPDLVADHVAAYVALVQQESAGVATDWTQRAVAWALAALGALVFSILGGVALMLGVLFEFHWILVVVPGLALLLTLAAYGRAKTPSEAERFAELKAQMASDVQALREAAQ